MQGSKSIVAIHYERQNELGNMLDNHDAHTVVAGLYSLPLLT